MEEPNRQSNNFKRKNGWEIEKIFMNMELRKFIQTTIRGYLKENLDKPQSKYFSNIGLKTEDIFDMIK
jgi:hypothetical protein